jgi:hypothetical protein
MLAFVFLPAILGKPHCSVLVLPIYIVSARCAYAAHVVGRDLDVSALAAVSL